MGGVSCVGRSWVFGRVSLERFEYRDVRSVAVRVNRMFERRSLKLPIALGVTMIVMVVALIVGWVLLTVFGALRESNRAALYWTLLSVGASVLAAVLVGVVMYLTLSIKAINLNRRQSNFIDSVTHELKSPIASLKLYLQTLTLRQIDDVERRNFHRFMLDDVERLDRLINHLLDAGSVERRALGDEDEEVDLLPLLGACADAVCVRYRVEPSVVTREMSSCWVLARRVDLDMVFRNLIDNAVKYARDPPQVHLHAECVGGTAIVRVIDNGPGIPRSQRGRIFARFVRLGQELERDTTGTGLGLHIVRTLVHRWRGTVRVCDREEGPGTVFEVHWPALSRSAVAEPAEQRRMSAGEEVVEA